MPPPTSKQPPPLFQRRSTPRFQPPRSSNVSPSKHPFSTPTVLRTSPPRPLYFKAPPPCSKNLFNPPFFCFGGGGGHGPASLNDPPPASKKPPLQQVGDLYPIGPVSQQSSHIKMQLYKCLLRPEKYRFNIWSYMSQHIGRRVGEPGSFSMRGTIARWSR